jgi:hypothetical protein
MTRIVWIASLLCVLATPVVAETCHEIFVRLLDKGNGNMPTKSIAVQQTGKAQPTRNYHYHSGRDDWMSVAIEPDNGWATLVVADVMYSSKDKGKTWKKVRKVDTQSHKAAGEKTKKDALTTVKNAVCGKEVLNKVEHITVEADFEYRQYKSSYHQKYWVHPKSGWISKSHMQSNGFSAIQTMEPMPDLKLPKPGK